MKKTIFIAAVILISALFITAACGNANQPDIEQHTEQHSQPDSSVALRFLNEYIKAEYPTVEWLKKCGMVTDEYITRYIVAEQEQQNGLRKNGGEPIDLVTGNIDYCTEGYTLAQFNATTGYVILQGIGETAGCAINIDDPVHVRIVQAGNKWLVDGSGIVNMPDVVHLDEK